MKRDMNAAAVGGEAGTDWKALIAGGETERVEFKSSISWDVEKKQKNKALEHVIAKTVASFMNTHGGILFIGVNDLGEILGLDGDLKLSKHKNEDGMKLRFDDIIKNYLSNKVLPLIAVHSIEEDNKLYWAVEISAANAPVYVLNNNNDEFWIRGTSSSRILSLSEAIDYIRGNFNSDQKGLPESEVCDLMETFFSRSDGAKLEILYEPYCEVCGNPIPDSFAETNPYCGVCNRRPDKHNTPVRVRAFGKYLYEDEYPDDILSNEIRKLKFDEKFVPPLLECLCHSIDNQYPDLQNLDIVIPVPKGSRGGTYNPSAELAEGIADRYNKPHKNVLYKIAGYRPMHDIHDPHMKEVEIACKIGCNHEFDGESILLINDTCITMATKSECAKVLHTHWAGEVWSLVLGRMVNEEHLNVLRRYND